MLTELKRLTSRHALNLVYFVRSFAYYLQFRYMHMYISIHIYNSTFSDMLVLGLALFYGTLRDIGCRKPSSFEACFRLAECRI